MTVEQFLERLEAVRRNGTGWLARCPAHEDREPSLSIHEGDDGRILVKCFKGCEASAIVAELKLEMRDLFPEERDRPIAKPERRRTERPDRTIKHEIRDRDGTHVATHVRLEYRGGTKRFVWERPNGASGLGGKRVADLPLYGIDRLRPGRVAIVAEGEKSADALADLGAPAVGTVTGASGTPGDDALRPVVDLVEAVFLWPDNDDPGRAHMERIATALQRLGCQRIRIVEWPEAPDDGGDAADFVAAGGTREDVIALLSQARRWAPGSATPAVSGERAVPEPDEAPVAEPAEIEAGDERRGRPSQADLLVELAAHADLFHDRDGNVYATVPVDGHRETWPLHSRGFRQWLARRFYETHEKAPGSQATQDALGVLGGQALFDGSERPVAVRLAEHEDKIYLDLCDPAWRAVEIDASGWRIVADPPVRFRRARGMLPLPDPIPGGSLDELRTLVNINESDWRLYVAWLVQALRPTGPYPVLALHGEQGAAKTTTSRIARRLIDPNIAPVRSEPREVRDLMIAAGNGWTLAFDNLSRLPDWLSDALCRLSTGGGFSTRALYSNDEEEIFDAQRPVILNGIVELATRPDLLDRALVLSLPSIPETARRPEAEVWAAFEAAHPRILGALLDAVSMGLRNVATTHLGALPRMADFALWASAAEPALGWKSGAFLHAYRENRRYADAIARDAEPVAEAVLEMVAESGTWTGSATALLAALNARLDEIQRKPLEQAKVWPRSPQGLSSTLKRLAPVLRRDGVAAVFDRQGGSGQRVIHLEKVGDSSSRSSPSSQAGAKPQEDTEIGCDEDVTTGTPGDEGSSHDRHPEIPHADADCDDRDDGDDPVQPSSTADIGACAVCGASLYSVESRQHGLCQTCRADAEAA